MFQDTQKPLLSAAILAATLFSSAAKAELVGHWAFDEGSGSTAGDSAPGSANPGAIAGAVWDSDAERGSFLTFDGIDDSVDPELSLPVMTADNEFTWAVWAKTTSTQVNKVVIGNRYGPGVADFSPRQFIKLTPTQFEWHQNGNGNDNIDVPDLFGGEWHHHTIVKRGLSLRYYRDGLLTISQSLTETIGTAAHPFFIGGNPGAGQGEHFEGSIDDVRVYDHALDAVEIAPLADALLVTNAENSGPGSLRQVVADAPDGYTALFDPAVFDGGPEDIINLDSQIFVSGKEVWVDALHIPGGVTISGQGSTRAFENGSSGTLHLLGLNIIDGNSGSSFGGNVLNRGTLFMDSCTVTGGQTTNAGGGLMNNATATLQNCTFHENSAAFGGGIFNEGAASIDIIHCTITRNFGDCCGGIVARGTVNIENSIVFSNRVPTDGVGRDINQETANFTSTRCIISSNSNCAEAFPEGSPNANGSYVGTEANRFDARLGALAQNGGSSMTRLPYPDSVAINGGQSTGNTPSQDQHGRARVQDGTVDIGAVEMNWGGELSATDPGSLFDVTHPVDPVAIYPPGSTAPDNESPSDGLDNDDLTKYLNFSVENAGLTVSPVIGACTIQGLTLTSANDAINRDPIVFLVLGSNGGPDAGFELIATGEVPNFADRLTKQTFFFANESDAYRHFRVVFPSVRFGQDPAFGEATQIAEIELLGAPVDGELKVIRYSSVEDGQSQAFPITNTVWLKTKPGINLIWQDSIDGQTWANVLSVDSQGYLTIKEDLVDPLGATRLHRFVENPVVAP